MTTSITSLASATLPLTGTERVPMDQTVGAAIAASALVVGTGYRIESLGTTNWTACGLPAEVTAAVGLTFVATAAGTGTGTAIEARTVETTTQAIADLAGAAAGTVTSVALSVPTGFSVSGSPVTTTGTLALSFAPGYSLPTDARQSDWDAAFTQRRTWDGGDQHLNAATGRASLGLGSAAQAATTDFVSATTTQAPNIVLAGPASGASAAPTFRALVAADLPTTTVTANSYGSGSSVGAFTVDARGRLTAASNISISIAATAISDSTSTGRAVLIAVDAAAARTAISAEQAGAAAAAQAAAVQRSNHTGTQLAATISDFSAAVAALGTTVGNALRQLVNPSAVSFLRINADNSVTARSTSEMRGDLGLTSAATATIGTAAGNLVALDGSARLPAVDASQLTGLVVGDSNIATAGLSQASLNGRPVAPFAPSTAYSKGDLVSLYGLVYRRKTAGTSGATLDPAMWDLQSAADGTNDIYYTAGRYFNPSIAPATTGIAVGQNTIFLYPFIVRRRVRVNGVQVRVLTAAASTTFQIAIYPASSARAPTGLPLASTTDMSLAAASAVAASISPIWLDTGQIYFRAINVFGSATGVFVAPTSSHPEAVNLIGATSAFPSSTVSNVELSLAWGYGNWPDMTGRATTEGSIPRVSLAFLVSELG